MLGIPSVCGLKLLMYEALRHMLGIPRQLLIYVYGGRCLYLHSALYLDSALYLHSTLYLLDSDLYLQSALYLDSTLYTYTYTAPYT